MVNCKKVRISQWREIKRGDGGCDEKFRLIADSQFLPGFRSGTKFAPTPPQLTLPLFKPLNLLLLFTPTPL